MVLAQIRYFLALYDELNFTRAAKRCGVSQPSLTNGIRNLECQLGGKLFDRSRSSQSQPTDLARALRPHLRRMNDSARQAKAIADQFCATASSKNGYPANAQNNMCSGLAIAMPGPTPPTKRRKERQYEKPQNNGT
jgi:Bacterial regulatory helix-turn-helix protein, lysR family